MLVDVPPAAPLVCTIETLDSRWARQPIADLRPLNSQQFVLWHGPPARVQPKTVVENRLTRSVQRFSSSGVDQSDPSMTTYHWSFDAPLSAKSSVTVSGELIIHDRRRFELSQQSRLTEAEGTRTLNTLQDTAQGRCLEQN